jgi:HEAT repeat protein
MQALIKKETMKLVKSDNDISRKFPKETIPYLLKAIESADNKMKSDIENKIVDMGEKAVSELVDALQNTTGSVRGIVAMSLIRIGRTSIEALKKSGLKNPEFKWVADYLTAEIEGSRTALASKNEALVG